eukprot:SAG31_NODE_4791_length_2954_cov_2.206305_4_plen_201_part_00
MTSRAQSSVGPMDDETFAWCLFQEADADGSGGLDRDEVAALARNLGRPLSEGELNEAMAEMDEDGGGTVDFDEFYRWYAKQTGDGAGWAASIAKAAKKYAFECIAGRQDKLGFSGGLASRMTKANARMRMLEPAQVNLAPISVPIGAKLTTFGPVATSVGTEAPPPKYDVSPNKPRFGRRSPGVHAHESVGLNFQNRKNN